jgi:hypothetical protein
MTYRRRVARSPRPGLEDRLAALVAMARGDAPVEVEIVRAALRGTIGVVSAAAARVIAAREQTELIGELVAAFPRLVERGVERDPQCKGKIAIARTLHGLDRWADEVFVAGVSLVQLEPTFGAPPEARGREDTAAELRAVCGIAYAQSYRGDAIDVLADLLADPQRVARAGAAQALGDSGRPDASALLRFKLHLGDDEPEVLSACVASLLVLAPRTSLPFVIGLLRADDDRSTAAALGLGERRVTSATPALIEWCTSLRPATRARAGYLALALLRDDAANAYLLERVREGVRADAIAAGKALATFRDDPALAAALREAAAAHPDRAVRDAIEVALA